MEESNDIILPAIPASGSGIRKTYEESIIKAFDNSVIQTALRANRGEPIFYEDLYTGAVYILNDFEESVDVFNNSYSYKTTEMSVAEIKTSDRFRRLILLSVLPYGEHCALVELIDPKVLRSHLMDSYNLVLKRGF